MTGIKHFCLLLAPVASLLAGCREPGTAYDFIRQAPYSFCLDLSDSCATYDISFTSRVDLPVESRASHRLSPALTVSFRLEQENSPALADTIYTERVFADFGTGAGIVIPYRSALRPPVAGKWRMDVSIEDEPEGFRGLGVIVKRNGTR